LIERRFPRVALKVPLFITVGGGRLYEKAISIESRDISGGGLSFETHREIPLDSRSKIVMGRLGNLPASAIIEGRVVYRLKRAGTDVYTVGVEFLDFVNTSREELLERIESWQDDDTALSSHS
jgi:c-di-GMP-binding flagellar brake protein YcgR